MPIRPRLRVTIRSHRPRSDHQAKRSTRCSFLRDTAGGLTPALSTAWRGSSILRADGGWRWPTEFLPLLLQRDWRYFEPGIARAIYGANQHELAHLAHANVLGCAHGCAHHLTVDIHQVCLHRYVKRELHLAGVLELTKDFCGISLDQHTRVNNYEVLEARVHLLGLIIAGTQRNGEQYQAIYNEF